ncbi:aromatic-ring-hydroxylating dioxygenase subunit beta [Steroidobacter sp.]|uniref:aromatic-ring-hydroxylating dioxygenase subunit beta n=1 Tax=Steroidobacter sp. TaxID=1978227 RepID=UPI001A5333BB|nr:aromatic-ring-hydroxylating dioxygenase subunit beta [Steroidobacter sp.]MBL8271793.1 nuclear transport factor 2 family protein [Steroidobacter sp.]
MSSSPTDQSLIEFVYNEARLLDEKRLDEWYELFADDGLYWMPLTRGQPEGRTQTSLFYEDRLLLKVRIQRLHSPNAFSQAEPSWSQHVLQAPRIESRNDASGAWVLRTPFMYLEVQRNEQQVYAGVAWHHLTWLDGQLRLQMKKIELLNCESALPSIQLLL